MESADERINLIVEVINGVPVVVVPEGTPPIDPELVRRFLQEEGFDFAALDGPSLQATIRIKS